MNRRRRGNESLIKQEANVLGKDQRLVTSSPTGFMVPMREHKSWGLSMNLLSPSLSSAPSGGEGARRAGEEAASVHGPNARSQNRGRFP